MSITNVKTAASRLVDVLFPAIPQRVGRVLATVLAGAAVVVAWAPAAITPWPWASVPGATVSSALGVGLLAAVRALMLKAWRHAASEKGEAEMPAFFGTFAAVLGGVPASAWLLGGGPLFPESRLSELAAVAVGLWGAHEAVYFYREHHRARAASGTVQSDDS